jgi:hypothetical protein
MTRAEQIARAVLDGSAKDKELRELAQLTLLAEDRIVLLGEMLHASLNDGRFIFDEWSGRAYATEHRPITSGRFVSHKTPDALSLPDRSVYLSYGEFAKDVVCDSGKRAP